MAVPDGTRYHGRFSTTRDGPGARTVIVQIIWLLFSYGVVFAVGGVLLQELGSLWGLALLVGFPAWRLYRRLRQGKGYYLVGYQGQVGGDLPTKSGLVTRRDDPVRFQILVLAEIGVLVFLAVSIFVLPGPG